MPFSTGGKSRKMSPKNINNAPLFSRKFELSPIHILEAEKA